MGLKMDIPIYGHSHLALHCFPGAWNTQAEGPEFFRNQTPVP